MKGKFFFDFKAIFWATALLLIFVGGGLIFKEESSKAFGGNFGPQMAQPGGRYQIAGCDANSAWVIDTAVGEVYLIYSNGKWKEVGSILDEKKRIKTKK